MARLRRPQNHKASTPRRYDIPPVEDEAQPQPCASIVKARPLEAGLTLPASSVAVAVIVYEPCASPRSESTLHAPAGLPGSAVPEMTGVALLTSAAGAVSTGTGGKDVSTVKLRSADGPLVFPAASVAMATTVCAPWSAARPG